MPTNIHKVFQTLKIKKKLLAFQKKLVALKILDLACGSEDFLTESSISLRRLENKVLRKIYGVQILVGEFVNP